jgi:hypothetical protein
MPDNTARNKKNHMPNDFDFRGLEHAFPSCITVLMASKKGLEIQHNRTRKRFRVTHVAGEFLLEHCAEGIDGAFHFVMRTDDLGRLLRLLGY